MKRKNKSAPERPELKPYFERLVVIGLEPGRGDKWKSIAYRLSMARWPEELGKPPAGWDDMDDKIEFVWPLVEYIQGLYGYKGVWRVERREFGMSDQEFDDYWDSQRDVYHQHRENDILGHLRTIRWLLTAILAEIGFIFGMLIALRIKLG